MPKQFLSSECETLPILGQYLIVIRFEFKFPNFSACLAELSEQHCYFVMSIFLFCFNRSEDENSDDDRISRHRRIHEPEVLSDGERDSDEDKDRDEDMER